MKRETRIKDFTATAEALQLAFDGMADAFASMEPAMEMFSGAIYRAAVFDTVLSREHVDLLYQAWPQHDFRLTQVYFRLPPAAAALILAVLMALIVLLLL